MGDMDDETSLQMSKVLITKNDESELDTAVLFLPGISGKAFSHRFQPLVDAVLASGFPIARVHGWEDGVDVNSHTWSYYHKVLDEVMRSLDERGYKKIIGIGKSFGGGLLLSYHHPNIVKKILWAPAIGVGDDATFEQHKNDLLSGIASFLDLHLTSGFISDDTAFICIIHGTADNIVPITNSEKIVQYARGGRLTKIEGADHSFKTSHEEQQLMEASRVYLADK